MPRSSGASGAEKGETIAGAKDAQTRTKSPSNASHAASVIASVLKKPPPNSRGSLWAETARSAAEAPLLRGIAAPAGRVVLEALPR